ncbi:MAG: cupin domain-containing protein [Gaiellaceae bacterium]
MRYCIEPGDARNGETALFGSASGCAEFEQRLLRFDGTSGPRSSDADDEVLYVLEGRGNATIGDEETGFAPGAGAYIPRGTRWRVEDADGLVVLSVVIRDPEPGAGTPAVFDLEAQENGTATAGRQFRLLATPAAGCATATQFVGFIPVGRAPDHFHKYGEVVYVLQGEGALHIDGETAPLRAGTSVHLPAGLVHCLENVGPGELQVLGVFRPAGSPAEAYYPDGTLAQY